MNDSTSNQAVEAVHYRQRYLQVLSSLGLSVAILTTPLHLIWGLQGAAAANLIFAAVCLTTILTLRRKPTQIRTLTQVFIFSTLLVTLAGIYYEKPDVIVDPWILTAPVVAYALCNRRTAAKWTAFTLICLLILRQYQISSVAIATTAFLALAVVSLSIVLHLFSSHIEKNESLIVQLGNTDSLTDTLNRRSFHEVLESEFRRNLRQRASMAVFMVDVDHFKNYNDRYGHLEGDTALVKIAQALKQTARRAGDFVFRYGGEEFCVICSGLDGTHAADFAEQLRVSVEALDFEHHDSRIGRISVSVGYRHAESLDSLTPDKLIDQADKALYLAKANGRNRVERYISA
jgi:diguanylate cyclase (GGDEF)-like protein